MARIPDGWIFTPKLKAVKKTTIEVTVDQKELVYCEHCKYAGWKIEGDPINPSFYCQRTRPLEKVPALHFCSYGENDEGILKEEAVMETSVDVKWAIKTLRDASWMRDPVLDGNIEAAIDTVQLALITLEKERRKNAGI